MIFQLFINALMFKLIFHVLRAKDEQYDNTKLQEINISNNNGGSILSDYIYEVTINESTRKTILELSHDEACDFLLKSESFFKLDFSFLINQPKEYHLMIYDRFLSVRFCLRPPRTDKKQCHFTENSLHYRNIVTHQYGIGFI